MFKSSLTIFAHSFQLNETYELFGEMINQENSSINSSSYLIVHIQQQSSPLILIEYIYSSSPPSNEQNKSLDVLVVWFQQCVFHTLHIKWSIPIINSRCSLTVSRTVQRLNIFNGISINHCQTWMNGNQLIRCICMRIFQSLVINYSFYLKFLITEKEHLQGFCSHSDRKELSHAEIGELI